jgi:hypothetical protein
VATTKEFFRVYEARAIEGSSSTNLGEISIYDNSESNELLRINQGESDAHAAIYTVPRGYTFYIVQWHGFSYIPNNTGKYTEMSLWHGSDNGIWRLRREIEMMAGDFNIPFQLPIPIYEMNDIQMKVKAEQAGGRAIGGFEGYIEKN